MLHNQGCPCGCEPDEFRFGKNVIKKVEEEKAERANPGKVIGRPPTPKEVVEIMYGVANLRVSGKILKRVQMFEHRLARHRIVLAGHGGFSDKHGNVLVPEGVRIFFYCLHEKLLPDRIGQDVDALTGQRVPVDVCIGPMRIPNYVLFPPKRLLINSSGVNQILTTVPEDRKGFKLSMILQHSDCQNADIHWSACRGRLQPKGPAK